MNAIDELRNLLEVFYEGRATAKDMARIRELFASVADLPDDLVADREVVDALSDPDLDGTVVPDEVGDMMMATIDSLPSSGRGISSRRIWLRGSCRFDSFDNDRGYCHDAVRFPRRWQGFRNSGCGSDS